MKTIVVAIDDSEGALTSIEFGRRLASQLGVEMKAVSVVLEQADVSSRSALLKARLKAQRVDDMALEVIAHHSVKDYLGALANREEVGVCMMAHGRRPVPEMLIGSVTAGVVRRSRRPGFLCGPRYSGRAHQHVDVLAVCVDGSALSEKMLPHAAELAKRLGARLQLLQVLDTPTFNKPTSLAPADVSESAYLSGLARRVGKDQALEVDWEVLHGDPAASIVSYLADSHHTMLAMTTHGRSGLSQVVAGSVSHEVVHEAPCPVVVLRP